MFVPILFISLIWTALHAYVISRLLSIPFVVHHVPPAVLIPVMALLGSSYIASRLLEHYGIDSISHWLEFVGAYWVGIFFLIFTAFLLLDVGTGFGAWFRPELPALRTGALLAALGLSLFALIQARRAPVVTEYEVALPGLPKAADGTVMVVASDMHMGAMLGHGWAQERARQFQSLHPDLVLLVGDIFEGDETTHPGWLPVLQQFQAPRGVYVVTGNHELYAGADKVIALFRQAGFRVLRDECAEPVPGLRLAGLDDLAFHGRQRHAEAMEQVLAEPGAEATVLLSHTPVEAARAAHSGAGLMLCGHTHEGQIWPFNYLVHAAFPLTSGRYDVDGMTVIVGRGTGTWGPRMRLWKRSELLRITLRTKA